MYSDDNLATGYMLGRDGSGNGNNGGFGNDGWWVLIILFAIFAGWGNGFGGNGNGQGATSAALTRGDLCQDMNFSDLENGVRGISQGLTDGFYSMNTNMLNGFAGVQNSLCQTTATLNNSITTGGYETRSAISDLGYRLQDCCCATQRQIDSLNYNQAQNTCAITTAINASTNDIVNNQNANYRALHDEIVANRIEDKNAQIAAQQNEINALRLAASQEKQNSYLVNTLRPMPVAAYAVPNPFSSCGYNSCGCGV